jgi:hypothetical protein
MLETLLARARSQDADSGYINNRKDRYAFTFSGGIFDAAAKQAEVFERVALPIAKNVLEGYNATIFCYGQTGCGRIFPSSQSPRQLAYIAMRVLDKSNLS